MQHLSGRGESSKGSSGDASTRCKPGCTAAVDHRPVHLTAGALMRAILHRRACSVSLPVDACQQVVLCLTTKKTMSVSASSRPGGQCSACQRWVGSSASAWPPPPPPLPWCHKP